jgi:hypothetical protein
VGLGARSAGVRGCVARALRTGGVEHDDSDADDLQHDVDHPSPIP